MFGTGSRARSGSPKPQAGWASSATSAWWHRYFPGRARSCKAICFLWRQQAPVEDQLAYANSALAGEHSKGKYRSEEKRNGSGLPDHLPSLPTGKTDRGEGTFCPRCKFSAAVMALKPVPMQCEGDPAEGSVGQHIWPSHSDKKPSGQNLQSHPSSANQRFFTTSITTLQKK